LARGKEIEGTEIATGRAAIATGRAKKAARIREEI